MNECTIIPHVQPIEHNGKWFIAVDTDGVACLNCDVQYVNAAGTHICDGKHLCVRLEKELSAERGGCWNVSFINYE